MSADLIAAALKEVLAEKQDHVAGSIAHQRMERAEVTLRELQQAAIAQRAPRAEENPLGAIAHAAPTEKGIYAWVAQGATALVLVNNRPSDHSPVGILNGHVMHSNMFYDGCAVKDWNGGQWFGPLVRFDPPPLARPEPEGGADG